jgi:hypothetical protein
MMPFAAAFVALQAFAASPVSAADFCKFREVREQAQQRRGPKDRGEYRQAAEAIATVTRKPFNGRLSQTGANATRAESGSQGTQRGR